MSINNISFIAPRSSWNLWSQLTQRHQCRFTSHISDGKGSTERDEKNKKSAESMFHIKQISCCLLPTYSWQYTFLTFLFALASCRSWPRIQTTSTICFPVASNLHHLSRLTKPSLVQKDICSQTALFYAVYNLSCRADMDDFNSRESQI